MINLGNLPFAVAKRLAERELDRRGVSPNPYGIPKGLNGMAGLVWIQDNVPDHPLSVLGRMGKEQARKDQEKGLSKGTID